MSELDVLVDPELGCGFAQVIEDGGAACDRFRISPGFEREPERVHV